VLGKLDVDDPGHDDFEVWSPSEERSERCLFGRQVNKSLVFAILSESDLHFFSQTLYHRRRRDRNCVVGKQSKADESIVKNCACTPSDFEW
jgi:hypothetical protein